MPKTAVDQATADRRRLFELLRDLAFEKREVKLASGRVSNFYVDTKQVSLRAEGHLLIGRLLLGQVRRVETEFGFRIAGVGGLTLGADPLASAVSLTSALAGAPLDAFLVRKEAKGHGTGAYIEGLDAFQSASQVAILEDVITTGASALKAVERVKAAGLSPVCVLAVVDRDEGGREALRNEGLEVRSLFRRQDFLPDA